MFMRFDRQPQSRANSAHQPSSDATGNPFSRPASASTNRGQPADNQDFREQADGAP